MSLPTNEMKIMKLSKLKKKLNVSFGEGGLISSEDEFASVF